jgi:hypothetical protein
MLALHALWTAIVQRIAVKHFFNQLGRSQWLAIQTGLVPSFFDVHLVLIRHRELGSGKRSSPTKVFGFLPRSEQIHCNKLRTLVTKMSRDPSQPNH